jgi:hypothetical protein
LWLQNYNPEVIRRCHDTQRDAEFELFSRVLHHEILPVRQVGMTLPWVFEEGGSVSRCAQQVRATYLFLSFRCTKGASAFG